MVERGPLRESRLLCVREIEMKTDVALTEEGEEGMMGKQGEGGE